MIEASGTNGALRFNFEFCASHKTSYYYMQFVNKLREKLFSEIDISCKKFS